MADPGEARWYVIHTYSGYEGKVASSLKQLVDNRKMHDLIQEIRVPTEKVTEITEDHKSREVERKVFPGYVLVKMVLNDNTWYDVRNIRGCTGFVGPESKPIPLTDEEVERMGVEITSVELPFGVGDSVKVVDGPMQGFIGIVTDIDLDDKTVKLMINWLGKETPVELGIDKVVSLS